MAARRRPPHTAEEKHVPIRIDLRWRCRCKEKVTSDTGDASAEVQHSSDGEEGQSAWNCE
jgi:hypothetical protein